MKRRRYVIASIVYPTMMILLSLPMHTVAQTSFRVGLSGGLAVPEVSHPTSYMPFHQIGRTSRKTFLAEGIAELDFDPRFSLQLTPRYLQGGSNFNGFGTSGPDYDSGEATQDFSLLEIPVLVKFRTMAGPFTPFLFAGMSVAFLLSAHEVASLPYLRNNQDRDVIDDYNSTDVRVTIGAGLELQTSPFISLFLDAAYTQGYSNIRNDNQNFGELLQVFTDNYQISFGALYRVW